MRYEDFGCCCCCSRCHCLEWEKQSDNITALGICKTPVRNSPWTEKVAVLLDRTDSGKERRHGEMGAGTRSNETRFLLREGLFRAPSHPLNFTVPST